MLGSKAVENHCATKLTQAIFEFEFEFVFEFI